MQQKFMKVAAAVLILLAVFNLNNAIALTGSNFTLENLGKGVYCTVSFCDPVSAAGTQNAVNDETISIESLGYFPNSFTVKSGSKVTLHLVNKTGTGCVQTFTIPSLGIQKSVALGASDIVEFTAPAPGPLQFMCSMGMYRGVINVI